MTKEDITDSVKIALIVGTMLSLINKFDTMVDFDFSLIDYFQILLNFIVPFSVASISRILYKKKLKEKGII